MIVNHANHSLQHEQNENGGRSSSGLSLLLPFIAIVNTAPPINMAEFCFAAAWTAGLLEGASVLNRANKQELTRRRSTPLLLFPSFFYGTVALPLGIIGASPGPSLVSSFPFAPPATALVETGGIGVNSSTSRSSSTTKTIDNSSAEAIPNKPQDPEMTTTSEEQEHSIIMSRHDMIRKMREDNKRALAAMKQKQHAPSALRQAEPAKTARTKRATRKLISTLDGRPLATPFAEAMRRARFLFVGAGLVLTVVLYEQSRQDELEQERALQLERQRNGRDVHAIQSLVNHSEGTNGAVVRLVGRNDSLRDLQSSKGVVPLFHDSSNVGVNVLTTPAGSGSTPYWNLGVTPQEWKQTPLTEDWLLQKRDNGQRCLVLEADVSPGSLLDYLFLQDPPTTPVVENVIWVSKILSMVAQQKGVLSPPPNGSDGQHSVAPVSVLIGCGERPTQLSDTNNTIYIDGPASVGAEVLSVLERVNSEPSVDQETKSRTAEETLEEGDQEEPVLISVLDYVGMTLRQGGTSIVTSISRVFSRGEDKRVYVLSDNPFAPIWLRQALPSAWTVLAYNALDDVDSFQDSIIEQSGVAFVCCQTDEATSAVVCSLLTGERGPKRLVALVQEESCASSLRDTTRGFSKDANVEIISVKGIHASLFDHARGLLASGMTPAEVQESIASLE